MKVSLSWLSDYVNLDGVSVQELQDGLFSCGFEVEEVISLCKSSDIVTCKILSIEQHPSADRLSVTQVDAGKYGTLQIVTNGKNIKVGDIVPVSVDGAVLADGTKIKKGQLRGVNSDGMFCGGAEIGINGDQYEGADEDCILVFKDEFPLGVEVTELLGIKDTIFDISITSNRPDCQCITGIAKEVACLLNRPYIAPEIYTGNTFGEEVKVSVDAPDLCPLYFASEVKDIVIEPSPEWMKKRLASVGIRSINNVVDITNYVLTEIGQPMHAFDSEFLSGKEIRVRRAQDGEKIVTLDEKEFTLNNENLVICDKDKPVALAGIMGGLNSGINDNTTDIIFESAKFKRDNIRKSSRKLGQRSDSSARFEKGVDLFTTERGILRALYLIEKLNCGKVSGIINEQRAEEKVERTLQTTFTKINKVLGIEVPTQESVKILNNLGFNCKVDGDNLSVTVPAFREDVEGYPDLAEEIIRFYGYDHITSSLMDKATITVGGLTDKQKKIEDIKDLLFNNGFCETINYSFIGKKDFENFGLDSENAVKIINPLGEELSLMRTSLIPSIVNIATSNINKMNTEGRIYEMANVYIPCGEELPQEKMTLSLAVFGEKEDFFTLKQVIENILSGFKSATNRVYKAGETCFLHPTRNADIFVNNQKIGYIGQIYPKFAEKLDLQKPLFVAELDVEALLSLKVKPLSYKAISKYPKSERDLALEVDKTVTNQFVMDIIRQSGVKALKEIELFDVYEGDKIAEGKKSLAYHLTFAVDDRTLSFEDVEGFISKILKNLNRNGINLRS